jgi:hypothetical protein
MDVIKKSDNNQIQLLIQKREDQNQTFDKGEDILLYSLLPEENNYCKFGESVYAESFEILDDKKFRLCALQVLDEDVNYKLNFQEVFQKSIMHLEEESHQSVGEVFYFVIQQVKDGKPIFFYCRISGFDEFGNILLLHNDAIEIVNQFENTEQFGFVKKNFQGKSCERSSSLFRKEGFVIQEVSENDTHMILIIDGRDIHEDFEKEEAFLRFQSNQIDILFSLD